MTAMLAAQLAAVLIVGLVGWTLFADYWRSH